MCALTVDIKFDGGSFHFALIHDTLQRKEMYFHVFTCDSCGEGRYDFLNAMNRFKERDVFL